MAYSGSAAEANDLIIRNASVGKLMPGGASTLNSPLNFLQGLPNTAASAAAASKILQAATRSPMAGADAARLMHKDMSMLKDLIMSPMAVKDSDAAMHPIVPTSKSPGLLNFNVPTH